MPALVACDVDGTLLDDGETVTKRTRDAVHAAVDAGTHFILATGRQVADAKVGVTANQGLFGHGSSVIVAR